MKIDRIKRRHHENARKQCLDFEMSIKDTGDRARKHPSGKVRVLSHPWQGYNGQREFAAAQCRNDWVLMLDADEECSPELRAEIEKLPASRLDRTAIFQMPRNNYVARRHVRCWGPDYQTRFVHKSRVLWDKAPIPEHRSPQPGFRLEKLRAPLFHNRMTPYSPVDFADGRRIQDYGISLGETLHARGRRGSYLDMLLRPAFTFLKYYLFKGGFLQGRFGLAIAYKTTMMVMSKYSVLYGKELEKENK